MFLFFIWRVTFNTENDSVNTLKRWWQEKEIDISKIYFELSRNRLEPTNYETDHSKISSIGIDGGVDGLWADGMGGWGLLMTLISQSNEQSSVQILISAKLLNTINGS